MMLYNAKMIRKLKKCFKVYDRIKEKTQRKKTTVKKDRVKDSIKNGKSAKIKY